MKVRPSRTKQRSQKVRAELRQLAINRTLDFAVDVKPDASAGQPSDFSVSITYNGYQWNTFFLNRRERRLLVRAMRIAEQTNKAVTLKFTSKHECDP